MRVLELPKIDELLNADFVEPFPYTKSFDEATREPFCLLHTSGSTGLPKPISWSHGLIGTMEAVRLLPPSDGDDGLVPWTSQWNEGDRIYSSFPMSHVRARNKTSFAYDMLIAGLPNFRVPASL